MTEIDGAGHRAYDDELAEATGRYFKLGPDYFARVDDLAEHYRQHNTAAVVFTIDAHTMSGHQPNSVEELIEGVAEILSTPACFGDRPPAAHQGPVRHRPPLHCAGPLAARFRDPRH